MAEPEGEEAFLGALRRSWDQIWAVADEAQRATLLRLVADPGDPVDVRADLADLVLELQDQLAPDHPVVAALRGKVMFGVAVSRDLSGDLARLRSLVLGDPAPVDENDPASDLQQRVEAAIRVVQSFDAAEIPVADRAGLILLPGAGASRPRLPRFQFDPDRRPREVVVAVNEVLEAGEDPWGVTCWWVYPHARLGTAPVELLDHQEQRLLPAARAVVEP